MQHSPWKIWLVVILLLLGAATVAYATAQLIPMLSEDANNRKSYAAFSELAARSIKTTAPDTADAAKPVAEPGAKPDGKPWDIPEAATASAMNFEPLEAVNPDCIGWLRIAGTVVDYPLVQGGDNDEYLLTGFDGEPRAAGTLFLDVWANKEFRGLNHPLYGHNMRDGSMFSVMHKYLNGDFALAHTDMVLFTPGGDWRLVPFAVYTAPNAGDYHTEPADEADVLSRAKGWAEKSAVDFKVTPVEGDRFLTFVTCNSDEQNRRVVLHTILEQ